MSKMLKTVFRLILVAWSILFPIPMFPVQYFQVNTVQEWVLPQPHTGGSEPCIVYWAHTIEPAEIKADDSRLGLCVADHEDASIGQAEALDLWLVETPERWQRLGPGQVRLGDGYLEIRWLVSLRGRTIVIFKDAAGVLDPAGFDAREYFAAWPPPL
jgi:hypothetical protein